MHQNQKKSQLSNSRIKRQLIEHNDPISKRTRELLLKIKESFEKQHSLSSKQIRTISIAIEFEIKRLQRKANSASQNQTNTQTNDICLTLEILREQLITLDKLNNRILEYQQKNSLQSVSDFKNTMQKSMQNLSCSRIQKTSIHLTFQQLSNIKTIAVLLKNEQYGHCLTQINSFIETYINKKSNKLGDEQLINMNMGIIQDYFYEPILLILGKQIRQQNRLQDKIKTLNQVSRLIEATQMLITYDRIEDLDSTIRRIQEVQETNNQGQIRKIKSLIQKIKNFHKNQSSKSHQLLGQLAQVNQQLQCQIQQMGQLQSQNEKLRRQVQCQMQKFSQQQTKTVQLQKRLIIAQAERKQLDLDQKQIEVQTQVIASLQSKLQKQRRLNIQKEQEKQQLIKTLSQKQKSLENQIKVYEKDCQQLQSKLRQLQKAQQDNEHQRKTIDLVYQQSQTKISQERLQFMKMVIQKIKNRQNWFQLIEQHIYQKSLLKYSHLQKNEKNEEQQITEQYMNCVIKQVKMQNQQINTLQKYKKEAETKIKQFKQQVEADFIQARSRISSPKSDDSSPNRINRKTSQTNVKVIQQCEYIEPGQILDCVIKSFRQKYDDLTSQLFQCNAWVYVQTIQISEYINDQETLVQILKLTHKRLQQVAVKVRQSKQRMGQPKSQQQFSELLVEVFESYLKNNTFKQLSVLGLQIRNFLSKCIYLCNSEIQRKSSCVLGKIEGQLNTQISRIKMLQIQNQQKQRQLNTLEDQLRCQKSDKRKIESYNQQIINQNEQLKETLRKNKTQQKKLMDELKKQRSTVLINDNQNKTLKQQNRVKQIEIEQLKKRNSQLIFQLKNLKKQQQDLKKLVQNNSREINTGKQTILKLQSFLRNWQAKQTLLINQNKVLEKKLNIEIRQRQNQEKISKQLENQIKQSAVYVSKLVESRVISEDSNEQQSNKNSKITVSFSHLEAELNEKSKLFKSCDSLTYSDNQNQTEKLIKKKQIRMQKQMESISSIAFNTKRMLDKIRHHDQKERLTISTVKKWMQGRIQEQQKQSYIDKRQPADLTIQWEQSKKNPLNSNQMVTILQNLIDKHNANAKHQQAVLLAKIQQLKGQLFLEQTKIKQYKLRQQQLNEKFQNLRQEYQERLAVGQQFQVYLRRTQNESYQVRSELLMVQQTLKIRQKSLKQSAIKILQLQKQCVAANKYKDQLNRQIVGKKDMIKTLQKQLQQVKSENIELQVANQNYVRQSQKLNKLIHKYQQDNARKQSFLQQNAAQIKQLRKNHTFFSQKYEQATIEKAFVQQLISKFRLRLYMSFYTKEKQNQKQSIKKFQTTKRQFFISYPSHPLTMLIKQYQQERDAIMYKIQETQKKSQQFQRQIGRIAELIKSDSQWLQNPIFKQVFSQQKPAGSNKITKDRVNKRVTFKPTQEIGILNSKTDTNSMIITQIIGILYRSNSKIQDLNLQLEKLKEQRYKAKQIVDKSIQRQNLMKEVEKQLRKSENNFQNFKQYSRLLIQQVQKVYSSIKSSDSCLSSIILLTINIMREAQAYTQQLFNDRQKWTSNSLPNILTRQAQQFDQKHKKKQQERKIIQLEGKLNSILIQFKQVNKWNQQLQKKIQQRQKNQCQFQIRIVNLQSINRQLQKQKCQLIEQMSLIFRDKQQKQKKLLKIEALLQIQNKAKNLLQIKTKQQQSLIQILNTEAAQLKDANKKVEIKLAINKQQIRQNQFAKRMRQQQVTRMRTQSKQKLWVIQKFKNERTDAQIRVNQLKQQLNESLQRQMKQKSQRQKSQHKFQKQKYEIKISSIKQKQKLLKTIAMLKLQKSEADQQIQLKSSQNTTCISRVQTQKQLFKKVLDERDRIIKQLREKMLQLDKELLIVKIQHDRQVRKLKKQITEIQKKQNLLIVQKQDDIEKMQARLNINSAQKLNKRQALENQDSMGIPNRYTHRQTISLTSFENTPQKSQRLQNQIYELKGIIDRNQWNFMKLLDQNKLLFNDCNMMQSKLLELNQLAKKQESVILVYQSQLSKYIDIKALQISQCLAAKSLYQSKNMSKRQIEKQQHLQVTQEFQKKYFQTNQTSIYKEQFSKQEPFDRKYNYISLGTESRDFIGVNTSQYNYTNHPINKVQQNKQPVIKIIDSRIINANTNQNYFQERNQIQKGNHSIQKSQRSRSKNYRYIRMKQYQV